jgi:hypothetical protein
MSMMVELTFFLGIQVKQTKQGTFIHQAKYTKDLMKKFNMAELKPLSTPISTATALDPDENGKNVDQREYKGKDKYTKWNDKKKYHFSDKKRKKFQKMMSQACAALSDLDFSSDDSSSSDEDEKPKRKTSVFTGLCLMGKSSWHISDSDSDVSDDSSPEGLSL